METASNIQENVFLQTIQINPFKEEILLLSEMFGSYFSYCTYLHSRNENLIYSSELCGVHVELNI